MQLYVIQEVCIKQVAFILIRTLALSLEKVGDPCTTLSYQIYLHEELFNIKHSYSIHSNCKNIHHSQRKSVDTALYLPFIVHTVRYNGIWHDAMQYEMWQRDMLCYNVIQYVRFDTMWRYNRCDIWCDETTDLIRCNTTRRNRFHLIWSDQQHAMWWEILSVLMMTTTLQVLSSSCWK